MPLVRMLAIAGLVGTAGLSGGAAVASGPGSPPGNNGTVKVAGHGDLDRIPDNTPHPGCLFQVEWYGFDEGPDVISTVTFAAHAPTADVGLEVDGPDTVFVGADPARGAGTDGGLDGREVYTLTFDGAPHPQQGYHVRLTVSTPHSQGNDTKTKMFWVEECAPDSPPPGTTPGDGATDEEPPVIDEGPPVIGGGAVQPGGGGAAGAPTVAAGPVGAAASGPVAGPAVAPRGHAVPTVIDSGVGMPAADPVRELRVTLGWVAGLLAALAWRLARRADA